MLCLSVCQPWAHGIVFLDKDIENRTWSTRVRGRIWIHAGKSRQWLGSNGPGELEGLPEESKLVFGAILGSVELYDCVPVDQVRGRKYAEGPFCFLLRDKRPLATPFPCAGRLGFWDLVTAGMELRPPLFRMSGT